MSFRNNVVARINRLRRNLGLSNPGALGKIHPSHPRGLSPVINILNGRLRLLHPQKYEKVPRHNPNPGPRKTLDFAAIREFHGSHTLSGKELGETHLPSRSVLPTDLRAGNHLAPSQPRLTTDDPQNIYRMGITRPEPSLKRRAHFPEMVNHTFWGPTQIADVPVKPLTMGATKNHVMSVGQDWLGKTPNNLDKNTRQANTL